MTGTEGSDWVTGAVEAIRAELLSMGHHVDRYDPDRFIGGLLERGFEVVERGTDVDYCTVTECPICHPEERSEEANDT